MNPQTVADPPPPPDKRLNQQASTSDLFERSDDKHDVERSKVGPLRLTANYQHPPIDSATRIKTVCVVMCAMILSIALPMTLREVYWPGRPSFWPHLLTFPQIWLVIVFPLLVMSWWKLGGQRHEKRLIRELSTAQSPLAGEARIEIRGRPSELLRFVEIRDEMFDPHLFQETHSMLGMPLHIRLVLSLGFLGSAGYILIRNGYQSQWWAGIILLVVAYFFLRGVPSAHRYYRFVPGRMDYFVYPWIRSRQPIDTAQFDLHGACIRIDLTSRKNMIRVAPVGDDLDDPYKQANTLEFRRDSTPSPLEFSIALVRAALSTATPPPLPMDALTG